MWKKRRTEAGGAFAPQGFEAHFVGCVAQIVVLVWDAPYERRLERCALFDDLLNLGGREETFLSQVLQLGEHLRTCPELSIRRRKSRIRERTCSCSNCTLSMTNAYSRTALGRVEELAGG